MTPAPTYLAFEEYEVSTKPELGSFQDVNFQSREIPSLPDINVPNYDAS